MFLKEITIKNFRNFNDLSLNFDSRINIFVGENGAGKTNLLEAIYFLGISKSFRTNQDKQLIKFDEVELFLNGKILKENTETQINISFTINNEASLQKKVRVNNKALTRIIDLIGQLKVIVFSPEDLEIVKGSPAIRRRFLDIELSQVSPNYLYNLQRYLKIIKHRNQILSIIKRNRGLDLRELDAWNDQLVETGIPIIRKRQELLNELNPLINEIYHQIRGLPQEIKINYKPCVVEEDFREKLEIKQEDEIRQETTLIGPHRDDISFYINDINARYFASQGQQRTIAICLKLAELQYQYLQTQESPILLLDDVTSELDEAKREALLNFVSKDINKANLQVFITTTDVAELSPDFVKDACIFKVKQGEIHHQTAKNLL
ncbi:MAG: DNA replication/repair protein RecF [bacterium]|nr:DNA replication/repair protein RecF [bacterium]